jgi:hypothetical protein
MRSDTMGISRSCALLVVNCRRRMNDTITFKNENGILRTEQKVQKGFVFWQN